jgi:signal peptidase I
MTDDSLPAETTPPEPEAPATPRSTVKSFVFELLQVLVLAAVLYFAIDAVIARVRVENISMEPTLMPGEFLLVNRLAYRGGNYQRGDVVIFHYPLNPKEDFIKRVIGVPGDTVRVENGDVFVNDSKLTEPYIAASPDYNGVWTVPADGIFVLGDNRNHSLDSHAWGFVPFNMILGKALVVYWPFDQAKVISHPDLLGVSSPSTP